MRPSRTALVVVAAVIMAAATIGSTAVIALLGESSGADTATICGVDSLDIPAEAQPWIAKAAESSGLPAGWLAAIARQESDYRPDVFADDINGGTWGLFQLNREEWHKHYPQGDNPGGTPHGITDPMIHAEVAGRYFKARLAHVVSLQTANPVTEWGRLPQLDALLIAHNAGEGGLMRYPAIPSITQRYLANVRGWFTACPEGAAAEGVRPTSGRIVSPIPEGTSGVTMTAGYYRYPSGGAHWGVDLAKGGDGAWTPVSICDGTVIQIRINQRYANVNAEGVVGSTNYVWIDCGRNVWIGYAHFYARTLNPALKVGVKIGAGTPIAPQGNQGNSSGSHLHLQISTSGTTAYSQATTVNPITYLAKLGVQLPPAP